MSKGESLEIKRWDSAYRGLSIKGGFNLAAHYETINIILMYLLAPFTERNQKSVKADSELRRSQALKFGRNDCSVTTSLMQT